jgi:hypothetical protein
VLNVIIGQHNKPKAAVHSAEMTGPKKKKKKKFQDKHIQNHEWSILINILYKPIDFDTENQSGTSFLDVTV